MSRGKLSKLALASSLVSLLCLIAPHASAQKLRYVTVHEENLRKYATEVVMPVYPERARKRGAQGVAVVQLDVDEQGAVTHVEVLESPDALIGEAVASAVNRWKFRPPTLSGHPVPIRGKLTFYYAIKNGKGRVENPRQFKDS